MPTNVTDHICDDCLIGKATNCKWIQNTDVMVNGFCECIISKLFG